MAMVERRRRIQERKYDWSRTVSLWFSGRDSAGSSCSCGVRSDVMVHVNVMKETVVRQKRTT
jgi:hypothetical protein